LLGIDPARNIQVLAASRAIPTIAEFFSETLAAEVARLAGQASLIVACNVLGHIDDLDDVCRGVRRLLAPNGAFVFEVPYLKNLLDKNEYDTVYHEHLSYFAVRPLATLLARHGLRMERVQTFPVHGGTIRCTARSGDGRSAEVAKWLEQEEQLGLDKRSCYAAFAERARQNQRDLPARLADFKAQGLNVVGYGAPAKGTVRLNYCGIHTGLLSTVVDSTPAKQGLLIPGTHQQILPPAELPALQADVLLLLAWNHAPEILARETEFQSRGGRFLTPDLEELHQP
jgi:novobiocin biosynthesis protein NovU/D-mycarose 3-C-methyltransferase